MPICDRIYCVSATREAVLVAHEKSIDLTDGLQARIYSFSKNFPAEPSMHSGLYDDVFSKDLSLIPLSQKNESGALPRGRKFSLFQAAGKYLR